MRRLRNLPIGRKLTIISLAISSAALLLACIAFATYEIVVFRSAMVRGLGTTADIVGANSAAGLAFNDPISAQQTLASLRAHPHIVSAAVYAADGKLFARYQFAPSATPTSLPPVETNGHRFDGPYVRVLRNIDLAGEPIGSIYIEADRTELDARLRRYAAIVVLVLIVASCLAIFLSRRLHGVISEPITVLAGAIGTVTRERNYAVRASRRSDDELGQLVDGFNEMLLQIQSRDAALAAAQCDLEQRVQERTRELRLEIAERHRAEEALRAQEERTRLLVERAFDAIISADVNGTILEWNAQAESIFGWTRAEAVGRNLADAIIPSSYREAHRAELPQFVASGEWPALNKRVEIEAMTKDGRVLPIELAISPIRMGDSYIFNAFLRDVSERKKAEAELAVAHKQLVEISRQAGMAEVATGVLHNVGNVLNSVNVSTALLSDSFRKSRISNLERVAALLREHESDLGDFLTKDTKGRVLPSYIANLADHLCIEREAALRELDSLRTHVEHIKEIVTMQQSYARVSGVTDVVNAVELLEVSLHMNAEGLKRHGIQLERDYGETVEVTVDKHKVLQILVNLLTNAKHACNESGRIDKCITARIVTQSDRVSISIEDNGTGIAPENLTRIFSHGFTTRKHGHGFGLHSAALAARELGGSLNVHSAGVGQGAAFTLDLPRGVTRVAYVRQAG